jgi:antitoxin HicB
MKIYTIRLELELDEPSGVYTVTSPDVPGLVTEGSTPEEIAYNVQEALDALIAGWKELGKPLPPVLQSSGGRLKSAEMLVAV